MRFLLSTKQRCKGSGRKRRIKVLGNLQAGAFHAEFPAHYGVCRGNQARHGDAAIGDGYLFAAATL